MRRPKYNEDTNCGCKICKHLQRNKKEWYCKVCATWFDRPDAADSMALVRENHEEGGAHIRNLETRRIKEMYAGDYMVTSAHRCGVTAEQLRKRGFDFRSTTYDTWYGLVDEDTVRVTAAIEKYLSVERRPVVIRAAYAHEECWNAIVCMLEIQDTNVELADIWMDFYLKVKRGEYES